MKVRAPFQGSYEHAGQGWDGRRSYWLVRFVVRAYLPFHDCKGVTDAGSGRSCSLASRRDGTAQSRSRSDD